MVRVVAVAVLAGAVLASVRPAAAQSEKLSGIEAALNADSLGHGAPALPPAPSPKDSTIFGGSISNINPVLDEFSLNIYGQHPMKILFDERTQLFRDGVRIPVHDLAPARFASVQTALDGTSIFAISVHVLSKAPTGDFRGRVLRFNRNSGKLVLSSTSGPPFQVIVPTSATFHRTGQTSFASQASGPQDLKPGALVAVTFTTSNGQGVANHVEVYAVPGSDFVFSGSITTLNMASGTMVLRDPRDQATYQLHFYPAQFGPGQGLHVGERVRVDATFDGFNYSAIDIKPY